MRGLLSSRRLWAGVVGVVALAAVATSVIFIRGTSAATPFVAHPISVHPQATLEQSVNNIYYTCQTRATARCYDAQQIHKAYDIQSVLDSGITGAGHTIVIVDAYSSPYLQQDMDLFNTTVGLPNTTVQVVAPDGVPAFDINDDNQVGWSAEISLDVQWAHAVAPGATILLVEAKSNEDTDILSATKYAVDHNLGDVISQSFGENESCVDPNLLKAQHAVFQAANAKGITLIASAGDSGAAELNCDGTNYLQAASSPASDPLVLGVGGTQLHASPVVISSTPPLTVLDPGGVYQSENEWNDGGPSAGGGGFSKIYSRPSYQAPFGVPNGTRGVPDVAYNAATDGGVIVHWGVGLVLNGFPANTTAVTFRFGGTSAGSPQWAGIVALGNQMAGHRLGFLQDNLYHIGKKPKQSSDFHDLTVGNNTCFGCAVDSGGNPVDVPGFNAVPGWDADGGLGSPDVAKLLPDLINTHVGNGGKNL